MSPRVPSSSRRPRTSRCSAPWSGPSARTTSNADWRSRGSAASSTPPRLSWRASACPCSPRSSPIAATNCSACPWTRSSEPAAHGPSPARSAETSDKVQALGELEEAEGIVRLAAAEGLAERSEELADSGAALAYQGYEEVQVGEAVRETAVEVGAAGLAEAGEGMEEIGSAGALEDVSKQLKRKK